MSASETPATWLSFWLLVGPVLLVVATVISRELVADFRKRRNARLLDPSGQDAVDTYRKLVSILTLSQEYGVLSREQEVKLTKEANICWSKLTHAERSSVTRRLSRAARRNYAASTEDARHG